ncbi:MAG: HYR domain-containing protein [Lewinellaceae bacterium]|nr:HYR domain-containing protein [Lewinellaceae bacterium]
MNRVLLLCLLLSAQAYGAGRPLLVNAEFSGLQSPVSDTLPPLIFCPENDTVSALPGECEATFNYTVDIDDDQPNPILIQLSGLASGSSFQIGNTTNVFLVTDQAGNTATCSFTVTVEHFQTQPICKDLIQIPVNQNCTAQVTAQQILDEPYGCPGVYVVELDKTPPFGNGPWMPANLTQDDLGKTYFIRVTDPTIGSNCITDIQVIDTLPPVLTCADFTMPCVVLNTIPGYLKDSLGIGAALPTAPDGCGGQVTLNFVDTYLSENCSSGFTETIRRLWIAKDESNNLTSCVQNIHLAEIGIEDVQLPPDITLDCKNPDLSLDNTGLPFYSLNGILFTDLCSVDITFDDSLVQVCPGSQQVYRTWTFVDLCDDSKISKFQIINVLDTKGPAVVCDTGLTVLINAANCSGEIDLPPVSFSDDCSPVVYVAALWTADGATDTLEGTLTNGAASFPTVPDFPVYSTTVTYIALDDCGNTGFCELPVTLGDSAAPFAGCFPLLIAQLSADGSYALGADTLDFNSDVACGQQLFYKARRVTSNPECLSSDQFDDLIVFCCADIGDTVDVILRVYDVPVPDGPVTEEFEKSQSSDCSLQVMVMDTIPARCIAPLDVSVSCTDFDPTLSQYGILIESCNVDSVSVSLDYTPFDSACSFQTLFRTFQVFDQNGLGSQCTQQIVISYLQNYYIKFPDDVIVTACNSAGAYGAPEFLNEGCGQMVATFTDEVFNVVPDACQKIERTWFVYNSCSHDSTQAVVTVPNPTPNASSNSPQNLPGPVIAPAGTPVPWAPTLVKVNPTDQTATDYSIFWDADANAYKYTQVIKIIDTQKPELDCPAGPLSMGDTTINDPFQWNQSYWLDAATGSNDLCEGSAALSITATDSCAGAGLTISYLLFLDLDGNNTQETVINSLNPPAAGTVDFDNAQDPNYAGGTPRVFDGRPVVPNDIYRFAIHQSLDGNTRTASVQWKTFGQQATDPDHPFGMPGIMPQLPHGKHRIKWYVSDQCGNEKTCEYVFEIKDTKAPVVNCLEDLVINIFPGLSVSLSTNNVILNAQDNCTPPTPFSNDQNLLEFGIRKAGSGSGFPVDSLGDPIETISYTCSELGAQTGELWAKDLAGNVSQCSFDISIEDPEGYCAPLDGLTVAGTITTEVDTPVVDAMVTLVINQQDDTLSLSDNQGAFSFASLVPSGGNYTLTPSQTTTPSTVFPPTTSCSSANIFWACRRLIRRTRSSPPTPTNPTRSPPSTSWKSGNSSSAFTTSFPQIPPGVLWTRILCFPTPPIHSRRIFRNPSAARM